MYLEPSTILVFCVVFLLCLWFLSRDRSGVPPGPWQWPVVGSLPMIATSRAIAKDLFAISKTYGPIFSIRLGSINAVVLSTYDLMHDTFKSETFENRPRGIEFAKKMGIEDRGIILNNGHPWKEMRKLALVTLKDLGVGKKSLEERIQEEALFTVQEILSYGDSTFRTHRLLSECSSNVICSIVFGKRFEFKDEKFQKLLSLLDFLFQNGPLQQPDTFIPWLRYVLPQAKAYEMLKNQEKINGFIREEIMEHRLSFDEDNVRDYVDLYLKVTASGSENELLTEESVFRSIVDLFQAGTETTATTITWTTLFMIRFPEMQSKIQKEIDTVIGKSRLPNYNDKSNMHYTQAFLYELMRYISIAPLATPHCAKEDSTIGGYHIPKDTVVFANIYAVHRDPKYWTDPETFNPERWLNDNGEFFRQEGHVPFSTGKRVCLGEQLARMEIFLFFTIMLQRLTFSAPKESVIPSIDDGRQGITMSAPPFEVLARER